MNGTNPTSRSLLLVLLAMFLFSFLSLYFLSNRANSEKGLSQMISFSVQPSEPIIHASTETVSMVISLETQGFKLPSREPVDLVCVVDFPGANKESFFQTIQNDLRKVLPLMNDQDRLSIFIYDEEEASSGLAFTVLPLTNTTQQNKDEIFLANWTSFPANLSNKAYGSLRKAIETLNQRETANPVTGIVLFSFYWNQEELTEVFQGLTTQHGSHNFLYNFQAELKFFNIFADPNDTSFSWPNFRLLEQAFQQSLLQLQTSILGILDLSITFETGPAQENKVLSVTRSLNLLPEMQYKLVLENVKVPNARKTTGRVRIASCKIVFTPLNGPRVMKNADLVVKVVKDEEEIARGPEEYFSYVDTMNDLFGQSPERIMLYKSHDGEVKVLQRDVENLS